VITAWKASRADPIRLEADDPVIVGRRDETWPDYRWCTGPDGREGWVPDAIVEEGPAGWVAARGYSAAELTVATGDTVEAIEFLADWWWCRADDGAQGWVPDRVLRPIDSESRQPSSRPKA
jgi:hypothetical protein